jgi:hypothetical protein
MRVALLIVLTLSFLLEAFLTFRSFVEPMWLHLGLRSDASSFSAPVIYVVAWFLLLVTVLIAICIWLVFKRDRHGELLSVVLGVWWIGIGLGLARYGITTNLWTDSAKGAVIALLAASLLAGRGRHRA